jgi:integrase
MPRTIRDSKLETRAARDRLKPSKKPYWKTVVPGALALGYRRKKKDLPGQWLVRRYIGQERYRVAPLGVADDFQDVGEGTRVLNFAEAQKAALAHKEAPRGVLTVAGAIADYVAWLKVHRATGEDAEQRAAKHILPTLGPVKVTDLTTVRLNNWRDALAEAGALARTKKGEKQAYRKAPATAEARRARRATANRTITILKGALNKAFNDGLVSEDLEWRRFKPFENVNAARPGYLTLAEAKRLINAADPASGFRDLVHAALQTGARYGELCALKVRDFHRGKLAIHQSKSGKPRDIVLSDEGVAFFEQLTAGRDPAALMLRQPDGGPWIKSAQSRPMREVCKRAKIVPAIGFHALRHSWASHAVMNGVPLMVVARNLGHASTAMVERHYGHLAASYIDDEIRKGAPQFGAVTKTNVKTMR